MLSYLSLAEKHFVDKYFFTFSITRWITPEMYLRKTMLTGRESVEQLILLVFPVIRTLTVQ